MKTRLLCAVMLLALAIGLAMPAAAQWDPPQGTTDKAQAVYLYQLDTETLVYAKNENERRAPASLTKLMTALLLVESGQPLDTPFTIPDGCSRSSMKFWRITAPGRGCSAARP